MKARRRFEYAGFVTSFVLWLCVASSASTEAQLSNSESKETSSLLDHLSEAQVAQSLGLLRANYLQPQVFGERETQLALLAGYLSRLTPGVELLREKDVTTSAPARPFLAEILDGRILYLRPGEISPAATARARTVLEDAREKQVGTVILDLRSVSSPSVFEDAARFAELFCPEGALLFRIEKPSAKQERLFTSQAQPVLSARILVLVNRQTAGASEVLAGSLRTNMGAILVGETSAGKAAEYVDYPIGSDVLLRTAVAEAIVGNGVRIFSKGLVPDFAVPSDPRAEALTADLAEREGIAALVFDRERPRMNEAALISETNPEIDAATKPESSPCVKDAALQKAVDLAIALNFFHSKR